MIRYCGKLKSSRAPSHDSTQNGFALALAIVLVAFMLVLVLTLSALVRVEIQSTGLQRDHELARQNALFGVREALGQLQKYAGPDQRVTARAEIIAPLKGVEEGQIHFDGVANPLYTFIWDVSGADDQLPGELPGHSRAQPPAVLVSGNSHLNYSFSRDTEYPPAYVTAQTPLDSDDPLVVTLFHHSGDSAQSVRANKGIVEGSGSFAWWVGDENVKARIDLNQRHNEDYPESKWMSVRHFSPQAVTIDGAQPFETVNSSALSALFSTGQLPFLIPGLVNGGAQHTVMSTGFSTQSRSLLTDVRNGGFKKDLSFGLDKNNSTPGSIQDNLYLVPRDLGGALADQPYNFNFIQWGQFKDFYNYVPVNNKIEARSHRGQGENYEMGFYPVIRHFQFGVLADYEVDGDEVEVRFLFMPTVVLWNPYPHDLELPDMHMIFREHREDSKLTIAVTVEDELGIQNEAIGVEVIPMSIRATTLPAGKAVVFSPPSGISPFNRGSVATALNIFAGIYKDANVINWLEPGWRPGAAFSYTTGLAFTREEAEVPEDDLPRISFEVVGHPRMYLALHERNTGTTDYRASLNRQYQLLSGFGLDQTGGLSVQPYRVESSFEPKLLIVQSMPFAENEPQRGWAGMLNPRSMVNLTHSELNFGYENLVKYAGAFLLDADAESAYLGFQVTNISNPEYMPVGTTTSGSTSETAILFDVPSTPLYSMAQFAHLNLQSPASPDNEEVRGKVRARNDGLTGQDSMRFLDLIWVASGDEYNPAYTVGNSTVPPILPLDSNPPFWHTYNPGSTAAGRRESRMIWDYSYLTNEVLFDRYFFSTIPQGGGDVPDVLPNSLYTITSDKNNAGLRNFDEAASHLLVEGGFNVNSTSVEAWTAFLSAMRNLDYADDSQDGSFFVRFVEPLGPGLTADDDLGAERKASLAGYRRLSDAQIVGLAKSIVEQVKLRGPFPSMAAFVNRVMYPEALYREKSDFDKNAPDPYSLYGADYHLREHVKRKGALAAALDLSGVNSPFFRAGERIDSSAGLDGSTQENRGFFGAVGTDMPGYVSQVDILTQLGASMTVRSDTFVIRSYGDVMDPVTDEIRSKAYAEVVVQRMENYVDDADKPTTELDALSLVNKNFGREFKVLSFRWLKENEL